MMEHFIDEDDDPPLHARPAPLVAPSAEHWTAYFVTAAFAFGVVAIGLWVTS